MLDNIQNMSYDYDRKVMIINLIKPTYHNNYMKKQLVYKVNEKTFTEKLKIWLEFKNNLKKI